MAQSGFLVIADITGYTAYLSSSELDHAEDTLDHRRDHRLRHTTRYTLTLSPTEGGTTLTFLLGKSRGPALRRTISDLLGRLFAPKSIRKGCRELERRIESDIAEGRVVLTGPSEVSSKDVEQAVVKSLTPDPGPTVT